MRQKLEKILKKNIALEHSAIVQYLLQSFNLKEVGEELEEIAKDEMRHMKYFMDELVKLGYKPHFGREAITLGESFEEMMKIDIEAEDMAIKTYSLQLEEVKEKNLEKLLIRVIEDEKIHRETFKGLLKLKEGVQKKEKKLKDGEEKILRELLREEYKSILYYLHKFFSSKNREEFNLYLDLALESMKHFSYLGKFFRGEIDLDLEFQDFNEEDSLKKYKELKGRVRDELKKTLERIEGQEEYHLYKLRETLKKIHTLRVKF